MRFPWTKDPLQNHEMATLINENSELQAQIHANSQATANRGPISNSLGGVYDMADTNHDIYADFGYPEIVTFFMLFNMYARSGYAKRAIEWPVDTGWSSNPDIEASEKFLSEFEKLDKKVKFWQRLKGLDTRQRVGQYGALFFRVKDDKPLNEPITDRFSGIESLVSISPFYQSQVRPTEYDQEPTSDRFGMPIIYHLNFKATGGRDEGNLSSTPVHWTRIHVAAEGSEGNSIFGVPVLEAGYNDLVDLRKINGGMAEGMYKNAALKTVFNVKDAASWKLLSIKDKSGNTKLDQLSEQFNKFVFSPYRKAFMAAGMDVNFMDVPLADSEPANRNSAKSFASSVNMSLSIIEGTQTGVLAGDKDERTSLSMVKSRQENWQTEMVTDVIDWLMLRGILPTEEIELTWEDPLASTEKDRLENAKTMAETNKNNGGITGGRQVYTEDEMREAAGLEAGAPLPEPDESLHEDDFDE